jgi:hypothetical protein
MHWRVWRWRWRGLVACGVLLLALVACIPTSEHPILTPDSTPDTALMGAWRGTLEDGGLVYLHFMRGEEKTLKAVLVTREAAEENEPKDEGDWAAFTLVTAAVEGTRYMSVLFDYDDGEPVTDEARGYHLQRYAIADDGTLSIFSVDGEALAQAVEAGKLKGNVTRDPLSTDVRVTSPSDALVAYLKTVDPAALFNQPFASLSRID